MFELLSATLALAAVCVLGASFRHGRVNVFEPAVLMSVFLVFFYLLPLNYYYLYPEIYPFLPPETIRERLPFATLMVLVFFISWMTGYGLARRIAIYRGPLIAWSSDFSRSRGIVGTIVLLYSAAWLARASLLLSGQYFQGTRTEISDVFLVSYASIFSEFAIVAVLMAGIRYRRMSLSPEVDTSKRELAGRVFLGMLALELVYALPSGRKEAVLLLPIIVLYLANHSRGGFRRAHILLYGSLGIVTVASYFAVNHLYRIAIEAIALRELSDSVSFQQVLQITGEGLLESAPQFLLQDSWRFGLEQTLNRLAGLVEPLLFVPAQTPSQIDYKYGATLHFFAELIPRVFWPEKPVTVIGNVLGREYGIVPPGDFATNISLGVPVEAYMNLGLLGVVVVGVALGYVLKRAHKSLIASPKENDYYLFLYFLIMYALIGRVHAGIGGTFGGLVKMMLVVVFVQLVCIKTREILVLAGRWASPASKTAEPGS